MSFVVVLPHWSFSISRLLSVPRTLQTSFSGLWGSTSNLSSTLDTFGCLLFPGFSIPSFSHFYRKSFCFVSVYPKVFFTSHTFSTCWHICNSDDSRVKLSMKFLYGWYHRVFPSSWHMVLNFWRYRYKSIVLFFTSGNLKGQSKNWYIEYVFICKEFKILWTNLLIDIAYKFFLKSTHQNCFRATFKGLLRDNQQKSSYSTTLS